MFDQTYLDELDETQLLEHYNWCRSRQHAHRSGGFYGLAYYYGAGACEVADALGRYYLETRTVSFSRRQIPLFGRRQDELDAS